LPGTDEGRPGWNEERLAALRSYGILDTPPEPEFDNVVRLAAQVCRTPVALITLVDEHRQWFKAEIGLGLRETPLEASICATAILQPGLFVVLDATQDSRFHCNPLVTGGPKLRFYAGMLLQAPSGLPLGTVCVLDRVSRGLAEEQAFALRALAQQVMAQLELRRAVVERDEALAANRRAEQRQALLVRELHHRVGNTLATVQALLGSTARASRSMQVFYRAFSARIASLGKTHTLLTDDHRQLASLHEMLQHELRLFLDGRRERVILNGPPVDLSADLAIPVGMALHELTTNAIRHGALSVPEGRVEIAWDLFGAGDARRLHLEWREGGGPPVAEPQHRGFGSALLEHVVAMQSNGDVRIAFDRMGFRFTLDAPLTEHRAGPDC
jgi:two-component sensor histidine kinase